MKSSDVSIVKVTIIEILDIKDIRNAAIVEQDHPEHGEFSIFLKPFCLLRRTSKER